MTVLVVGLEVEADVRRVRASIERAGTQSLFAPNIEQARSLLQSRQLRCVLAAPSVHVPKLNAMLREQAECFGVPLIALSDVPSERVIVELHLLGADDVVDLHDHGGLTRRLSALSSFDPGARTAQLQGHCLLVHPDPYRRKQLGRVLRQAGFHVAFAACSNEAVLVAKRVTPKLIVLSDRVSPSEGVGALQQLSETSGETAHMVLLSSNAACSRSSLTVVPEGAPADDLLFVINELLKPRALAEARSSRRILHYGVCAFRVAGEASSSIGLTYNISREGMYVRSFDVPPAGSRLWLELCAPGTREVCHLRGRMIWSRTLSTGARGAVPPGFGVRIELDQCPPEDRDLYVCGYELSCERVA